MNATNMKKRSETDWKRVEDMRDEEIDTSYIPPLGDAFFSRAGSFAQPDDFTMKFDADLVEWFKAQGEGCENLINAAPRGYVEGHGEERR